MEVRSEATSGNGGGERGLGENSTTGGSWRRKRGRLRAVRAGVIYILVKVSDWRSLPAKEGLVTEMHFCELQHGQR